MSLVRLILVGGFLGSGKTTTIARLARTYVAQGLKVGIITNDQATDLVDTHTLRAAGFDVREVAGLCFCSNIEGLMRAVEQLESNQQSDVILAEPVGSCIDIVATVVQPLQRLFPGKFRIGPYGVILKPSHGRKILSDKRSAGFSPGAAYIFRKQLEAADFVILNRIDELSPDEVDRLAELIATDYPAAPVVRLSAKTGAGFETLLEMLDRQGEFGRRMLEVDYDVYAEGEAELGWLNSSLRVVAPAPFSLDDLSLGIVRRLQQLLVAFGAEPAHVKTISMAVDSYSVANVVSSDTPAVLSRESHATTCEADVIVNARAAAAPGALEEQMLAAVGVTCQALSATADLLNTRSCSPARPRPTYRRTDDITPVTLSLTPLRTDRP